MSNYNDLSKMAEFEANLAKKIDPNDATALQSLASNPKYNVWVGASAGTGKTKVLTERVMRLLLPSKTREATPPDRILCITFTKAAAAEMASRIQKSLSKWISLSDEKLYEELQTLTDEEPTPELIKEARRLFARVVDHGNRLKIMTIHSFCESVLGRFPIEAGLSPDFSVIDEREAKETLQTIIDDILDGEELVQDNAALSESLRLLALRLNTEQFQDLMEKLIKERSAFAKFIGSHGGIAGAIKAIYDNSTLAETDYEPEDCLSNYYHEFDFDFIERAYDCFITSTKNDDQKSFNAIQGLLDIQKKEGNTHKHHAFLNATCALFLTKDRKKERSNLANKDLIEEFPEIMEKLNLLKEDFLAFYDRYKQSLQLEATKAMVIFGYIVLESYEAEKRHHMKLDFDDLISYTVKLLQDSDSAAWVLYKIDGGIDHILLDEAQDTSLDQWSVISAISEEFFSGEGRYEGEVNRTIFVVGDEKQSIYSFQKADPKRFAKQRDHYQAKLKALGRGLVKVPLSKSFRSTTAVLETVDNIFNLSWVKNGVTLDHEEQIKHFIHRQKQTGCFEVWPLALSKELENEDAKKKKDAKVKKTDEWVLPTGIVESQNADDRLANKIALTISNWIRDKKILNAKNRPIQAGDIMILLRSRGSLMGRIVKSLKRYAIPVAGIDRIKMNDEIAIKDLIALANTSLLRIDDLTLATVLKSPFIKLSEDELMTLSLARLENNRSLWAQLAKTKKYEHIAHYLQKLQILAQEKRAYEFFSTVLERPCPASERSGYHALYAQLGQECYDPLSEFLNLCLSYEQNHNSFVQKFIDWFEGDDDDIKRDAEADTQNQVRIMTVHGSKGLQAPIVFLADAAKYSAKGGSKQESLFWTQNEGNDDIKSACPLWVPNADLRSRNSNNLKDNKELKDDEEYRRLLYVALTRAEDHVIVTGTLGKKEKLSDQSWYGMILKYAEETPIFKENSFFTTKELDTGDNQKFWSSNMSLIWHDDYTHEDDNMRHPPQQADNNDTDSDVLPNWLLTPPKAEPSPTYPLSPSNLDEEKETLALSPLKTRDENNRFLRGTLLHNLLQFLPEMPQEKQFDAAQRFIYKKWNAEMPEAQHISTKTVSNWAQEIMDVLNHADFRDVFGENSRAEVPLSGLIQSKNKGHYVLSGQIDRLVIKEKEILIVDFKTNRPAAETLDDIPRPYLKQMALYCDALSAIYPEKTIKTAILWTHICKLMILPSLVLDPYRVAP